MTPLIVTCFKLKAIRQRGVREQLTGGGGILMTFVRSDLSFMRQTNLEYDQVEIFVMNCPSPKENEKLWTCAYRQPSMKIKTLNQI